MFFYANIFQPLIDVFEAVLKFFHNSLGVPWGWAIVLLTVVTAGIAVAVVVARLGARLLRTMMLALAAGAAAGLTIALFVALAGGSAGPGRMSTVGASPWQTGLAVAVEVAVVSCGAAGAMTWQRGR